MCLMTSRLGKKSKRNSQIHKTFGPVENDAVDGSGLSRPINDPDILEFCRGDPHDTWIAIASVIEKDSALF